MCDASRIVDVSEVATVEEEKCMERWRMAVLWL